DNGNHLLLSGNRSAMSYLREIGAEDTLYTAPEAIFPFIDLRSGLRWSVRPNRGRIPWWIFDKRRRVPDTTALDYLTVLRLAFAGSNSTVAACVGSRRILYERFWEPLAVAALNTAADEGASRLLWPVVMETFGRSGDAARPCMAKEGLSTSFVDPALEHLSRCRTEIAFNRRLRGLGIEGGRVSALDFADGVQALGPNDRVILAVPPARIAELLPGMDVPLESRAIVNAHFRL